MGLRSWMGLNAAARQPKFLSQHTDLPSYSQLKQDLWVLAETRNKREGFFVEVGAFDGIQFSNSYLLEKEFAWSGILAEPNPSFSESIAKSRSAPLCTNPVSSHSGRVVTMLFCPDAPELSAMAEHASLDQHAAARQVNNQMEMTTISLNDLLENHDAPRNIDFISLDTEGSELDILSTFDCAKYDVKLMCIEHNGTPAEAKIDTLMISRGYSRVHKKWSQFDAWYCKS